MHTNGNKISFIGASLSLIATFIASGAPIPLYGTYQNVDGLIYVDLSLSSVLYFVGAVTALLIFGRLSDHFGRRPIAWLALLLSALSAISFLTVHSALPLIIGRFLQGLSCGLASTALAAWVVDCAHNVPAWIAPAVVSCGPMTGLTVGGIGSGILVQYGPAPRQLSFLIVLMLLVLCTFLIFRGEETMRSKPGALRSLRPRIGLPPSARKAYPLAACAFVCTWALGGFFQAFGPAMAHEELHSSSAVVAALVFASIMAPSSLGASLAGRVKPVRAQAIGMVSFSICVVGLVLALKYGFLVEFLIASVLAGIAQGAILSGSIQSLVAGLAQKDRANVLAVIYVTSYTGAAVPTMLAGQLSEQYDLLTVASGYAALAIVGTLFILFALAKQHRNVPTTKTI